MTTLTYRDHSLSYRHAGWNGVLPVPADRKGPPPKGCTGAIGVDPDDDVIEMWRRIRPRHAIALRVPQDVIGLDVDAYGARDGGATLAMLEGALGALPPTWRSSARTGVGGIRFFRVPTGRRWAGIAGTGVDVIQWGHRYAVVAPSTHHSGQPYRWYLDDEVRDDIPNPVMFPELPAAWVAHLDRGER